jgi:hypothetical protein
MAEGKSPPKRGVKGLFPCVLGAAVVLVGIVIVIGGVAIWITTRSFKSPNQSFLTVISSPKNGAVPLTDETITLEASSAYDGGVTRLDL